MIVRAFPLLAYLLCIQQVDAFFTMPGTPKIDSSTNLISKAKTFINTATGFYSPLDPDQYAEDLGTWHWNSLRHLQCWGFQSLSCNHF